MKFINRIRELNSLDNAPAGLVVLFGRRRVGKTALIEEFSQKLNSVYSQAIEGSEGLQISQLVEDLQNVLPEGIVPRSWPEVFSSLSLVNEPTVVIIDEFPYLVKTEPALPSIIQRWIDHKRPTGMQLVLLGSSQTMMHDLFLNVNAPLYERAKLIVHVQPMSYVHFCDYFEIDPTETDNFENYSLVGGIPRYWELLDVNETVATNAWNLYFKRGAPLEMEPTRLLRDEQISGMQARSTLEALGRGAHRPSEIAARLGINQTAISTPLQQLIHTSLIERQVPFGENIRSTKRVLYHLADIALRFWFNVYSPHRSRWHLYDRDKQHRLIHEHASYVLESSYRKCFIDAELYWEKDLEFDAVRYDPKDLSSLIISEVKHRKLEDKHRLKIAQRCEDSFYRSRLGRKFSLSGVEVLDTTEALAALCKHQVAW